MPKTVRINKHGDIVETYWFDSGGSRLGFSGISIFTSIDWTDEVLDRVRNLRKVAGQTNNKRLTKACNIYLGFMGDDKQEYLHPYQWPIELSPELDSVMYVAEGIMEPEFYRL